MKVSHTRESDFHTVEVDVDVDEAVFDAIHRAATEISDATSHVMTDESGTKIFIGIATPKGRKPGDPFYTMHRITIEKLPAEGAERIDHIAYATQALLGVIREINTSTLHSSPTSQFECLDRALKNAKFAIDHLKLSKGQLPDT